MAKTVLILGGGVGGIVAANELAHKLGREHRIVLVDRSPRYIYSSSLLWVMAGWRRPEQVFKDLRRLLSPGVEMVQSEIRSIEPGKQKVTTGAGELSFDYLLIALGAELAPTTIPGYGETVHDFYTLDGVMRLTHALESFSGGRIAVLVTRLPFKCPAAPYEAALLLRDVFRRKKMPGEIAIDVYTPETLPMPVAGPVLGQAVKGLLEQKGVAFHPNLLVESINSEKSEIRFHDGASAAFDLLIAVPPHRIPRALEGSSLVNQTGWVPVDRRTLRTSFSNIYAVGDIAAVSLPNGKLLPKAGVFAHSEAQVVANNIAADILGTKSETYFDGLGYCWVETGGGYAAFASGNFYAEPAPAIKLYPPGRRLHWGKVLFENYWLGESLKKETARWALTLGSQFFNIKSKL